jgi:type II secretory pathway pseudopilin PulG
MMRRDSGYSLIEALGALVILGFTFVLIVSGIGTSRRVWERLDTQSNGIAAIVAAQTLLRDRLEQSFPQTRFDASAPYVDFHGEAATMEFLAPATGAEGRQALRRYDLALSPDGELVLASASQLLKPEEAQPSRHVLLRDVDAIAFAYFGSRIDKSVGWAPRWQSRDTLPSLVRLQVQFRDGHYWPDLIIHPAATVDSLCVLDVARGSCRGRAT